MPIPQSVLRAMSGGVFLIFLAIAFAAKGFFLPLLFVGLALSALFGGLSGGNPKSAYGGMQGFIWLLGVAFCFAFGWWPWILLVIGASSISGALNNSIIDGLARTGWFAHTPPQYRQSSQPHFQTDDPHPPYQEGYQSQSAPQETYQEGGKQHIYTPQYESPQDQSPLQYEQPQAQYPQEMPPQQKQ